MNTTTAEIEIPKIPLGEAVERCIDFLESSFSKLTKSLSLVVDGAIRELEGFIGFFPPIVVILFFALVAWWLTRRVGVTLFTFFGFAFIWNLGLFAPAVSTLVLVLLSTSICVLLGIPLGIAAALSVGFRRVTMPALDFMQTLPAFVYLIPAIPFFGLGNTSAIFSTVVFAMPPAIRLTVLGIDQTPKDLTEAADAFGATRWQKLVTVQLPTATPSIMAGVNQTIMLALSMVVISAMIGAGGLGSEVWKAIQRLQLGAGFEAGVGIVILAIVLDRIMRASRRE
ncbi:MAG: proline/glycine betaine ABC transporter permease [Planctomycetes bacterium]|nr:proline/glycine betaine ABC transporter permease [Planctomycetota bacterium]